MNAMDLHTSRRVVGSYYDFDDWRQLEQSVNSMTHWQLEQLCERMGWSARFEHRSQVLDALRSESWNAVTAAIEAVKGNYN